MKMNRLLLFGLFLTLLYNASAQQYVINRLKSKVYIEQNQFDLALELLQNTTAFPKADNTIYCDIGYCYFQKQNYTSAIYSYLKADSVSKNIASIELARCYAYNGDNKTALIWLEKHLAGNPKKPELEIITDNAFESVSKTSQWDELWKKQWYSEAETEINAVNALLAKGMPDEAQIELETYQAKISPKHIFFALQAKAYLMQKMPKQSLLSINEAIEKHSMSAEYYFFRSQLLLKSQKYADALNDISKAIKLNNILPKYYIKRAEISRLAGNKKIAELDLKIYEELYPESVETNYQRGLLEKAKGNLLTALDYYDTVIDKDATKAVYFLERGKIALEVKQVEKADGDFGMVLDFDPNNTEAYLMKGNTRFLLEDIDGACFCWKKAKQHGSREAASNIYKNCKE